MGDQIKKEMGRSCSAYGGRRGIYRVLGGKPEGERQLGRSMSRRQDNIKMDLRKWDVGHELDRTGLG
jgi:hypothetical protein